jgi:hypothetical protein
LTLQPGGHALQTSAIYENTIDVFENKNVLFPNRIAHVGHLREDWTFFPYSKAYFDGSIGFYSGLGSTSEMRKSSSTPVRAILGLDTNITPTIVFHGWGGVAKGFYDRGDDYLTPVGAVGLAWDYTEHGRTYAQYRYDFTDSINANYYRDHAFKLGLSQQVGPVVFDGTAEMRLRRFHTLLAAPELIPSNPDIRDDVLFEGIARAAYALSDWLSLTATYRYTLDNTSERYMLTSGAINDPSFVRQEVVLGVMAAF